MLLFVEHGKAPDAAVAWQDRLDAALEADRGGMSSEPKDRRSHPRCRLYRDNLRAGYMRGPRPFTFMYEGRATRE